MTEISTKLNSKIFDAAMNNTICSSSTKKNILIIGLGLIGGSLALALKRAKWQGKINAVDANKFTLDYAKQLNLLDSYSNNLTELVQLSDIIVLAVPVLASKPILQKIAPLLKGNQILTDVGSCKAQIIDALEICFGSIPENFIAAHPIAGLEKSGLKAAKADLFKNHKIILSPTNNNRAEQVKTLADMWLSTGANIAVMDLQVHDATLALTSHLPHLLAYALVDMLAMEDKRLDIFNFAAGGFRDFSRIAASDPTMWHDIFLANKTQTTLALEKYIKNLQNFKQLIEENNSTELKTRFSLAKASRDYFSLLNRNCMAEIKFILTPQSKISGVAEVPGDKSISHRSIMLGAIAEGVTRVEGFLESEDALATLEAFTNMGVEIYRPGSNQVIIQGVGLHGLQAPNSPIYLGNSGTSMRLLSGILAGQTFDAYLTGDNSLSARPMGRVVDPLTAMGANIQTRDGKAPLHIFGRDLHSIEYSMPMASAQVKSAILLAGIFAKGKTQVIETEKTRDHTERMLQAFGYPIQMQNNCISLEGGHKLVAKDIKVPADISSAAFLLVAAAISPGSDILIKNVGVNPTRIGIINLLQLMGANLILENIHLENGEEVADLHLLYKELKGIEVPQNQIALAIDEFPIFFIAAACAKGITKLRGAKELRVKESDRLAVMAKGLQQLGVECTLYDDGIDIIGRGDKLGVFNGGVLQSHNDHRIAMSFAIASIRASAEIIIENCATVASSFPNFAETMQKLGLAIEVKNDTD